MAISNQLIEKNASIPHPLADVELSYDLLYIISLVLSGCGGGRPPFHPFVSSFISSSIHPSSSSRKKKKMEGEEDEW
jgi:hypothetical protein